MRPAFRLIGFCVLTSQVLPLLSVAQQPSGAATLEDLSRTDESTKQPVGPKADGANAGQKRPAGTLTRPKDGVQHPDLDKAWEEYEAAVFEAAEGIRTAIAKQFDAATEKGDLDAAEKWQAAAEQFEKAGALPNATELKTPVNTAVGDYRKAKDQLVKTYDAVVKALTMDKDIQFAKRVREEAATFKGGRLTGKAAGEAVIGKRRLQGLLFASGDDTYAFYVNDRLVTNGGTHGVKPVPIAIGVGDVITVKSTNASYAWGFVAILVFEKDKKQITTNSATWKCYLPKNPVKWFEVGGIADAKAAVRGVPEQVAGALAKVVTADAETIWGSQEKDVAYLTLTVEESSFMPMQAVPVSPSQP